jgi:hypothetical protein
MNWPILILVGIGAIALIVFLVVRNNKDEKVFEKQLNNDFTKPKEETADDEIDTIVE